jgi:pimeloyl-ACP methyl ester carboxylesterase
MRLLISLLTITVLIACQKPPTNTVSLDRSDYLVPSADGVQLYVREIAPDQRTYAEPMVLIHGGGPGATGSFDLPVPGGSLGGDLAKLGFQVYLVNIRGWEQSTVPEYDLSNSSTVVGSVREATRDIAAAVDWITEREEADQVHLFGWATGGHWAAAYTTRNPDQVKTLTSLNSLYGVYAPWPLRSAFARADDSTAYAKNDFFRRTAREDVTNAWDNSIPTAEKAAWRDPAVAEAYRRTATSFGEDTNTMVVPAGYREESFNMSQGLSYWDARDLTVPTLIIRSELDFWSRPEDLMAMCRDLTRTPRKRCITIPGTHYVFLDRPERGRNDLIKEILKFTQ